MPRDRFDATGRAINNNLPSELVILHLPQALPLTLFALVAIGTIAAYPLSD